jgi:hypothetical protein
MNTIGQLTTGRYAFLDNLTLFVTAIRPTACSFTESKNT